MESKKLWRSLAVFAVLVGLTAYMVLRDGNMKAIIDAVIGADLRFLFLGFFFMVIFIVCEGINIGRCLELFGYKPSFVQKIKYALAGFFFSSVTPSSSGGQPMQVYYMHKDGIAVSHSSLALLIELASFQLVMVSMAVMGLFFTEISGGVKLLIIIGVSINLIVFAILVITIFSKNAVDKILGLAGKVVKKLVPKKAEAFELKASAYVSEYRSSARYFKENKAAMVKIVFTTLIQIAALHSIPFCVYCALGLNQYGFLQVLLIQAVLYVSVSALPLPGAVGASEGGFMVLFKTLFPAGLLGSAMILSRFLSFYLFVIISGLIIACMSIRWQREPQH